MTKNVLIAKVNFLDFNEHKLAFVEEYLGEQVGSSWGKSEILEKEEGLSLYCKWYYANFTYADEDYACVSQRLDTLKRANIVLSFSASLEKEASVLNHS